MEDNKKTMFENDAPEAGEIKEFEAPEEFAGDAEAELSAESEEFEETGEFGQSEDFGAYGEFSGDEEYGEIEPAEAPSAPEKPKTNWKKELREWIVALAAAALIAFVIRACLFTLIRVDGDSMYRTLNDGERLFVTIADVKLFGVERGDVVICKYPNRGRTYFVKRVVGVPGDQVERVNGVTWISYTDENGETVREPMDENRSVYYPEGSPTDYEPYTLGEDEYFVVGDNRYNSHDSRDWKDFDDSQDVGPISGDMIVGQAQCVIWPLNAIRGVK